MRNAELDEAQAEIMIAGRNTNNLTDTQMTPPLWQKATRNQSFLIKVKEEREKAGLKFNIQKMKIMASGPITSWQIDGETMETVLTLFLGAPKSLQMVIMP